MKKVLNHWGIGFVISFLGSLPLGYLNLVGHNILTQIGWNATFQFCLGVIGVEVIVIYTTLRLAIPLVQNKKLMHVISFFSMLFMFAIAAIIFSNSDVGRPISFKYYGAPIFTGFILSCFNIAQIPFWTGWNLNLLINKRIQAKGSPIFSYLFGCGMGTFLGMILLIFLLNQAASSFDLLRNYLYKAVLPILFCSLGVLQAVRLYRK
ncbi:MAG: hypothetical protein RLZZ500_1709 [Bacteroidota bacterium]